MPTPTRVLTDGTQALSANELKPIAPRLGCHLSLLHGRGFGALVHDRSANATGLSGSRRIVRTGHSLVRGVVPTSSASHRAHRVSSSDDGQIVAPFSGPDVPVASADSCFGKQVPAFATLVPCKVVLRTGGGASSQVAPLASDHPSSRVPGGVAHPALALPVVLVVTGERYVATRKPDQRAGQCTRVTGSGNTLAVAIGIAPTGRKETHDVDIERNAGRPMALNRQAEDVLIDLKLWRRRSLANNGRIDPDEAMEALPMVEEAGRILSLMAPTWGHINSCLDAATGMFSAKVQRNHRETVARHEDNMIAFPEMNGDEAA